MIFVDTGAFLARYIERDQHHRAARKLWQELGRSRQRLATSNFVMDEMLTLLGRRADFSFAAARGRLLFSSMQLVMLRPDPEDELRALELFEKFADQQVSFTDAVSFALMAKSGIDTAFTFDAHFARAGFATLPGR